MKNGPFFLTHSDYTVSQKKMDHFSFEHNFVKHCLILIILIRRIRIIYSTVPIATRLQGT